MPGSNRRHPDDYISHYSLMLFQAELKSDVSEVNCVNSVIKAAPAKPVPIRIVFGADEEACSDGPRRSGGGQGIPIVDGSATNNKSAGMRRCCAIGLGFEQNNSATIRNDAREAAQTKT